MYGLLIVILIALTSADKIILLTAPGLYLGQREPGHMHHIVILKYDNLSSGAIAVLPCRQGKHNYFSLYDPFLQQPCF